MDREDGSTTSKVTFGGYDESLVDGDINYHNVNTEYYWMIEA